MQKICTASNLEKTRCSTMPIECLIQKKSIYGKETHFSFGQYFCRFITFSGLWRNSAGCTTHNSS